MANPAINLTSTLTLNLSTKSQLLLAFLTGLSLVFAYAPYSFWFIPFIALPGLFWLSHRSQLHPAKIGFAFGLGWFGAGISWVFVSIDQFGGLPIIVSLLLMVLLCGYLALYPSLAFWLAAKVNRQKSFSAWGLCLSWPVTEWLRAKLLTGFPWLSLGYSQTTGPFKVLAPIIGEHGISLVMLLLAASLTEILLCRKRKSAYMVILSVLLGSLFASQQTFIKSTGEKVKVALIQGNIEQSLKWHPEQAVPTMLTYMDLTRQHYDADLIIWPESAVPSMEPLNDIQAFLTMADKAAAFNKTAIITGIINYNFESRDYFNSLIVLGNKRAYAEQRYQGDYFYNNGNRYYKHHLLPIGEFVPFQSLLRPLAPLFNLPMSSFTRGNYQQPNLQANGYKILPLICFEIAFAQQLKANFHNDTQLLLTVSNDAWFGDSHGPHQHMEIGQMRALEFGRPLLRATNNGVTAVTDAFGNIVKQLPQFKQGALVADVALVSGRTPYSRYGDLPLWIFIISGFISQQFHTRYRKSL